MDCRLHPFENPFYWGLVVKPNKKLIGKEIDLTVTLFGVPATAWANIGLLKR
ncbi:hypothetical protein [Bacteroides xylanisolvens]|uniref:hypothetical protein n=1 Tax=Bacteroides xylanisolvens TaxID=371601 RepID=UPI0017881DC2|nr:hypothetical protein [Bacteroides xylanisolvens]